MLKSHRVSYMVFIKCYYSDTVAEKEPPKPKPRQRTFGKRLQTVEKKEEDAESQDFSRPQTSSTSIPFYTDTSSDSAVRNFGALVSKCIILNCSTYQEHFLTGLVFILFCDVVGTRRAYEFT